jgi:hypothetical protein
MGSSCLAASVLLFTAAPQAQQPAHPKPGSTATQTDTSRPAPSDSSQRVTLTGCVERADQVTNPAATVGLTVDSLDFVLIHANIGSAEGASATPAPVGTSGTSDAGRMYRLDADVDELNRHVGHKVEVVGSRDVRSQPPAAGQAAQATNPNAATAPLFHVDSVKMVSETCDR